SNHVFIFRSQIPVTMPIALSTCVKTTQPRTEIPSRSAKRLICTLGGGTRGNVAAKGQRIANIADRLEAAARAARADRAIAKGAAKQRLVDIHTLDFVAVHLNRVPGQQAGFVDDAVVGYRELSRRAPDETTQRGRERKQGEYDCRNHEG